MVFADTVFMNGKVATVDKDFSYKQAIAVKNGWIIDVGTDEEIRAYIGADTQVIDLGGKVILPGIHDAHLHLSDYINNLHSCDCSRGAVQSVEDLQRVIGERVKKAAPGEWVLGSGLDPDSLGGAANKFALDPVSPDIPVVIATWDGHSSIANSKALEICGINRNTPDPVGGRIVKDENGDPTGVFLEASAFQLVFKHVPRLTVEEIKENLIEAQKLMNSNGYTSYCECTAGPANNTRENGPSGERCIQAYKELLEEGKLTARVSIGFYPGINGVQSYDIIKDILDTYEFPKFADTNWVDMHMLKMFCDGVHMTHSAWMKNDYVDASGDHGHTTLLDPGSSDEAQEAELRKMIQLCHDRGWQIGIHTIGDKAVSVSIDAFVEAQKQTPGKSRRHYVIHADSLGDREDFAKAAKYGIGNSIQSVLMDYVFEPTMSVCGQEKGEMLMGVKDLLDMGLHMANGSDTIAGPFCNWLKGVQSAVTRRSKITGKVYRPDLALSVEEAVRSFTYEGAYQEFAEDIRGTIEIGKVADFCVIDQDIFTIDPEEISNTQVLMTMVDGRIVYQK